MTHTKHSPSKLKKSQTKEKWYDVDVVVELLIHEIPHGEKNAPEIANLCVGFSHMTDEKLSEELDDMRAHWPYIFPRGVPTSDILRIISTKYPSYEEILALHDPEWRTDEHRFEY